MSLLQYSDDHHAHPGEYITPSDTYILTYDSKDLKVSDYFGDFENPIPLLKFKAVLANTLDAFATQYADGVMAIVIACEEIRKKGPNAGIGEKVILDPQSGFNLIGRSQANLDTILRRVMEWDGKGEFTAILPYVVIAEADIKPGDIIGGPRRMDTANCKPLVNGMMFQAVWNEKNGMLRATEPGIVEKLVAGAKTATATE